MSNGFRIIFKCILCGSLCLITLFQVQGQSPDRSLSERFSQSEFTVEKAITTEEGLPANGVKSLLQNSDGYIWMATYNGLVRYDGVRMKMYNSSNIDGLETNRFLELFEDSRGRIWAGLEQNFLLIIDGSSTEVVYIDEEQHGFNHHITDLSESKDGQIWIGTTSGLFIYDSGELRKRTDIPSQAVQRLLHTEEYTYVMLHKALYRISHGSSDVDQLIELTDDGVIHTSAFTIDDFDHPNIILVDFFLDGDTMYILTHSGLVRLETGGYEVLLRRDDLQMTLINGMLSNDDLLYLFGMNGLVSVKGWKEGETEVTNYSDVQIHSMLIDHEGSIWAGSNIHGVLQFVHTPVYQGNDYRYLDGTAVTASLKDQEGNFWTGTNCDGLYRKDEFSVKRFGADLGIHNTCIWALLSQRDGTLWAGSWGGGVYVKSPGEQNFVQFDPEAFNGANVFLSVFEDSDGTIWFGSYLNGLFRYDGEHVTPVLRRGEEIVSGVRSIFEDESGRIWLATDRGIGYVVDGHVIKPSGFQQLRTQNFRTIAQDREGRLWFGSFGGGIQVYSSGADTIAITGEQGLIDETISQLVFDPDGNLWLGGNLGVFYIDRDQIEDFFSGRTDRFRISRIGVEEGLPIRETTGGFMPSGYMTEVGQLYVPTVQGLARIHAGRMVVNRHLPNLLIEEVQLGGESIHPGELENLPHDMQRMIIRFTALSFKNPEYVRFQYKMEGLNEEWQLAGDTREVSYTTLPPGDYRFRLRASNNDGFWTEEVVPLAFTVVPPYWQTAWFYFFVVLAVAAIAFGIAQYRVEMVKRREMKLEDLVDQQTARLREEKEKVETAYSELEQSKKVLEKNVLTIEKQASKLKKQDELKSRFYTNISHELRTPLTLITGITEKLQKNLNDKLSESAEEDLEIVSKNADRLKQMIEQLLELSELESGEMELQREVYVFNIQILMVADIHRAQAKDQNIELYVDLPEEAIYIDADRERMRMILTYLMSNAVSNTVETERAEFKVELQQDEEPETVVISVTDYGRGLAEQDVPYIFDRFHTSSGTNQSGTGLGLALVREFVEQHGGDVEVKNIEGEKTEIRVVLPVHHVHSNLEELVELDTIKAGLKTVKELESYRAEHHSKTGAGKPGKDMNKPTVLVVEDERVLRKYIHIVLSRDYNVIEANNGKKGLEVALGEMPDIIVTDIMMPEMDGYEMVEAIRADERIDFLPIVMLTARASEKSQIEGLKEGANAYLTKPFKQEILLETIRNLIESQKRLWDRLESASRLGGQLKPRQSSTFLDKLNKEISDLIDNSDLTIEELGKRMNVSQRQLQRNVKESTGLTPKQYLRKRRLDLARQLIELQYGSVTEVAYAVGFNNLSLFSSYFKNEFGHLPSKWS